MAQESDHSPHQDQINARIPEVTEFFMAILAEAERGCVLLAASYLDEALDELLRSKFKRLSGATNKELKPLFVPSQTLGTFSGKVRIVRAMGLIEQNEAASLRIVGEIRNKFAHRTGPATIDDARVATIVDRFDDQAVTTALSQLGAIAPQQVARMNASAQFAGKNGPFPVPSASRVKFMASASILFLKIKLANHKTIAETSDQTQQANE